MTPQLQGRYVSGARGLRRIGLLGLALFAFACGRESDPAVLDSGVETDARVGADTGASMDASATSDAGPDASDVDSGMEPDAGTTDSGIGGDDANVDQTDSGVFCDPSEVMCACATGYYCLFRGGLCLVPSAPCP